MSWAAPSGAPKSWPARCAIAPFSTVRTCPRTKLGLRSAACARSCSASGASARALSLSPVTSRSIPRSRASAIRASPTIRSTSSRHASSAVSTAGSCPLHSATTPNPQPSASSTRSSSQPRPRRSGIYSPRCSTRRSRRTAAFRPRNASGSGSPTGSCACPSGSRTRRTSSPISIAPLTASKPLPRAIVFNCHITGLAVARSLAAKGVDVIALDPDPRGLGQASRAVTQRHKCPNPLEDERGFVEYLLDNAKRFGEGAVLFPTNDEWVMAVARYRSQLEACYRIPFSELAVIEAVLDKRRLYADAHHLRIPIPKTYTLNDPKATAKEIRYPAIVKPAEQRRFYDRFGVKVFRAENAAELVRFAGEAADLACVAQEIVDVPAGGFYSFCSYVAPDGEVRGAFVGRKLEQYPEGFGTGCLVIGEHVSEIVERGSAILKAFGYHGISEVEFIWDPARKEHLLLDVNPRVWKWIGLPIASGVDLPWLAYSEAIGQPERAGEPRDGLRWIYERDYALLAQSRPLFPATGEVVNAVWDPDDPGPFAQLILNEGPAGRYYCAC